MNTRNCMYGECVLEELKPKIRRKLELVRRGGQMFRIEEGYEEALLAVISMIHRIEKRYE